MPEQPRTKKISEEDWNELLQRRTIIRNQEVSYQMMVGGFNVWVEVLKKKYKIPKGRRIKIDASQYQTHEVILE